MIDKNQDEKIKQFIESFKEYSKTEEYKQDMIDRKERVIFFSKLNWKDFKEIDEFLFGEIISKLWASQIWTNKDYLVKKVISSNGFENLKMNLWNLMFASFDISKRFPGNIKGLGPASLTELLCLSNPKEYGIWNDKARKALKILGFDKDIPIDKYKIDGSEYKKFNEILKQISIKLEANGFKNSELLFVDYFLYFVWLEGWKDQHKGNICRAVEKSKEEKADFDHDEVVDQLVEIGEGLGFETESKKKVGNGAVVDLIWRVKVTNLGTIIYVFEVQRKGSIDSLIVNLQKAKRNASVQKLIVVSDIKQLESIKKEVKELSEDFRKSLSFWDIGDVEDTYQKLSEVKKSIEKLELVKDEFEIEKE